MTDPPEPGAGEARPPRYVDKTLAEDVFLDDEREPDEIHEVYAPGGADEDGEHAPEPPPWREPEDAGEVPSRAHPCWSCAAQVPAGAESCPECLESARHLRLISTRPRVDVRHGSCGPLHLGRLPSWAPLVAGALDGERGVSRRHAVLELTGDGALWLTENAEGTLNGTFVDDERITPGVRVPVTDGATVRLGTHCAFTVLVVRPPHG
ncbi:MULTISPECIES: FHA domain-containing protein [unclassified Streptomyces]|uniref:FHA domain-containing protein n=1 Tax=unclassified Streptomyces TaxID=2593676 RepID=UPI003830AD29